MGKTRVHLLAKELGIETKDLIAQLDRLGMRGRKAQSALEDDEVARVRAALAAQEKPQIHVGEEKIVADRMVKSEVEGLGAAEAHETVVERRVRANVIRRRVNRTEVAPSELVTTPAEAAKAPAIEQPPVSTEPVAPAVPVEEFPVETSSEIEAAAESAAPTGTPSLVEPAPKEKEKKPPRRSHRLAHFKPSPRKQQPFTLSRRRRKKRRVARVSSAALI